MTAGTSAAADPATPLDAAPAVAARLHARTVALDDGLLGGAVPELLAIGGLPDAHLWHREGFALAGRGVGLCIELPTGLDDPAAPSMVRDVLAAIDTDDPLGWPGCGPVALGALPFDRTARAVLTVPAVTVGIDGAGHAWLTTVGVPAETASDGWSSGLATPTGPTAPTAPASLAALADLPEYQPPDQFSLVSSRPHADWEKLVADTVAAIRDGLFDKVVLAREIGVTCNRALLPADILRRLQALYPSCMVFSTGHFLGASPELLISRRGRRVRSHPLAGTVARSGDPAADAELTGRLLESSKEREEHRLVVDAVAAILGPACRTLDVPVGPSIVGLRNVSHLGTLIEGELAGDALTALDLVARLHPTPAVAGTPTSAACAYLQSVEGFDRGCYAGPVGWMDRHGDGEWAVAVRSAEVHGDTARLFAGVGVVGDSDPAEELAETQLKLQALLAAVVRP